ncbi:type IX secretion system motor protein PorM/GldM [Marinirhabdus gelatinilytica]|uniref:Protein involved in gliding motility GldM n=1 Tax=Marinirhabdus gelatinilytica TaxID=1703343 RepID=A0A370QL82_9FLAO|nr:gliding motility protein GldM [Marinirhabdus gelatinilytica]RDK89126.1 protein involved in gliding motility GldM [Marinirhabdus gelatinilytica]
MAGGQSPRQKMINLMYLVFIAMLALNMSKEVLSAFGLLNNKIETANAETAARNTAFMDGLSTKASDEPAQYAAVYSKAQEIETASNELDTYLSTLKSGAIEGLEDPTDYEVMDKPDYYNNLFFTGDNYKPEGQEFIDKMNNYRTEMMAILSDTAVAKKVAGVEDIKKSIENNFSTAPEENRDGKEVEWLNYHYEGFPLIASLTKLTQLQADVKTAKSEILSKMLSGQQAAALSFSNYSTIMDVEKSAYYSGETFNGAIMLGRTDASTVPQEVNLTLDGRPLTEEQYDVVGGKVVLKVGAGSPGDHKIEGTLVYGEGGEKVEVPVKTGFATISKPNAAVIAADKMNVVYRGVDNPMTVSIPGIPDNKVSASGAGLSKVSGSKYVMRPQSGTTVTITASGTLPDGQKVSSNSQFRIKGIPAPLGTIRGESGIVRMQRQGLEISSVGALLEDFDFDLNLRVTGFSFKVSGQPTVVVSGTKLNGAAKAALRRAKRGDVVQIFDINTSISGSNVKLRKTAPVTVELTN